MRIDYVQQYSECVEIIIKFVLIIYYSVDCIGAAPFQDRKSPADAKMYSRETLISCAILIGIVASISSIDASSPPSASTTHNRNFKENDILRDEDRGVGAGEHRPLDVNRNNAKINDSDNVDGDATVGHFSVIDSDVENSNDNIDDDNDDDDDYYGENGDGVSDTAVNDSETDEASIEVSSSVNQLSLKDQVRMLTRQLSALTKRQRSDYKSLAQHVRKSARKATKQFIDELDIRHELEQLR